MRVGQTFVHGQSGGAGDQSGVSDQAAYGLGGSGPSLGGHRLPVQLGGLRCGPVEQRRGGPDRRGADGQVDPHPTEPDLLGRARLPVQGVHQVEDPGGPADPARGDPHPAREEAGTLQVEVRATDLIVDATWVSMVT